MVALGEGGHGNEQGHAFRLSLVRDPRFAATVNDIVVEFGAAQNQGIIDRFVDGEDVPINELRKVWQDTTVPTPVWDVPIYEEFYRAVREVNCSLPKGKRLRILLGDPPVDWNTKAVPRIDSPGVDYRDSHPAKLIQKEVLMKRRRALVIYGGGHFFRRHPTLVDVEDEGKTLSIDSTPSLLEEIERENGIRVFNIMTCTEGSDIATLQPESATWPKPSLIMLKGTILGAQQFGFYRPKQSGQIRNKDGTVTKLKELTDFKMEDQFDAMLYVGPLSSMTYSELPAKLCLDSAWLKMRKHRAKFLLADPHMEKVIDDICKKALQRNKTK